ncbi:hypothetical protein Tco_0960482, partial [Tanacetum coccineum]
MIYNDDRIRPNDDIKETESDGAEMILFNPNLSTYKADDQEEEDEEEKQMMKQYTTTATTLPTTTLPEIPNFASLFSFDQRVSALETELSEFKQTSQFTEAVSSISGIVDNY